MATATKTATKVQASEVQPAGRVTDIRHMLRVLGPETNMEHNIWSYDDAERHLRETYFNDGWELWSAIHLNTAKGRDQGGLRYDSVEMLYILVKRATA